jgi:death-on-curing protein
MIQLLTTDDVLDIHAQLVEFFRSGNDPIDPPGLRDLNLLGSAISRPSTSLGRLEKYPSLELKAAALFYALAKNHAFHNGNKRTALVSMLSFLDRNGRRMRGGVPDDDVFDAVIGVASDKFPVAGLKPDEIVGHLAAWIKERTAAVQSRAQSMRTAEFLERCRDAGLRVVEDRVGWKVQGKGGMIKIARDKRELKGNVVRVYLQNLGVTDSDTGITVDTFQGGLSPEHEILLRFHAVLKRLARS